MANVYAKRGVFYSPPWINPRTREKVPAHSLGTADRIEAETAWTLEQADRIRGVWSGAGGLAQSVEQPTFNRTVGGSSPPAPTAQGDTLSDAITVYLTRKARTVKPVTLESYRKHVGIIVRTLGGNTPIAALDGDALEGWVTAEAKRLGGRTHTIVKRLEAVIKPALKLAHKRGRLERLPIWPEITSDYRERGIRQTHFSHEQIAQLRAALPERRTIRTGSAVVVFPRVWLDLELCTGLHPSDLDRLRGRKFDRDGGTWERRNSKGDAFYHPEWLPCDGYMLAAFEAAERARGPVEGDTLWVADVRWDGQGESPLPENWIRGDLERAAKRLGWPKAPTPNDLRRTFATWRMADGWEYDLTAKWLGNSAGMVRETYAKIPTARMREAIEKTAASSERFQALADAMKGPRRGPKTTLEKGSEKGSKLRSEAAVSARKVSR